MEFLKSKAGKVAIAVALLVVAIVLLALRGGSGEPPRADKSEFVCVATGKTFWLDRETRFFPFENPDTGEKTLLPCHEGEDGGLYVSAGCRDLVKQLDRDGINKYVDPQTLRVRTEP